MNDPSKQKKKHPVIEKNSVSVSIEISERQMLEREQRLQRSDVLSSNRENIGKYEGMAIRLQGNQETLIKMILINMAGHSADISLKSCQCAREDGSLSNGKVWVSFKRSR